MKRLIAFIISITPSICSCQEIASRQYEFRVEIKDDSGNPVENASVTASKDVLRTTQPISISEPVRIIKNTNHDGQVEFIFNSAHQPGGVLVEKSGYYLSTAHAIWKSKDADSWTADISAILRPVKNPIPMHASLMTGEKTIAIPEFNREYGFDLMMAEARPPLGKGKVADFKFTISGYHHGESNYDMLLNVRFSNPEDGVVEFSTPQRMAPRETIKTGSLLISGYEAPETGYDRGIERHLKRGGTQTTRESNVDFRRNFYFRTRTKIDPEDRIISAHYGKIYGDFQFSAANKDWGYVATLALITTYFNPTPNDRNVEFDTKRNLNPDGKVQLP